MPKLPTLYLLREKSITFLISSFFALLIMEIVANGEKLILNEPTMNLNQMLPYLPAETKFGQGNIFTPVCHPVHKGVPDQQSPPPPRDQTPHRDQTPPGTRHPPDQTPRTRHPPDQTPPGPDPPPGNSRLRNTVNDRPVRILLECILVSYNFQSL